MIWAVPIALLLGAATPAQPGPGSVCAASEGIAPNPRLFPGRERRFAPDIARDRDRLRTERLATIGLGDSIMQRWPEPLLARLFGGPAVGMGVGGYDVAQVLGQLDATDWRGQRPRTVVLMIGTNDLSRGAEACDLVAGVEAIRARVLAIFPGATLTVVSVLPRGADLFEFADRIERVNATLRARSATGRWRLLDAHAVVARRCADARRTGGCAILQGPKNVHPTPDGYELLAQMFGRTADR